MLKYFSFLLLILAAIPVQAQQNSIELKLMTSNIRYANPDDGVNFWDNRKDWYAESVNFSDIDIFGAQEALYSQVEDIKKSLNQYDFIGTGRDGGNAGEFSPIFYKKERFQVLDSATFWLSPTPDKVASKGWDAALPRIVTWAKFKEKSSGKIFFFFNTHFDHMGVKAREESAQLILNKAKDIAADTPFFLTGDFNVPPSENPYKIITKELSDSALKAEKTYGPPYTFNGFQLEPDFNRDRIDYIFYKGNTISIAKYQVLDAQRGALFISDHFPVIIDVVLK